MARKPNYDFEKRRKELDRKTKKEARLIRKRESAEAERNALAPPPDAAPSDGSVESVPDGSSASSDLH